MHHSGKDTQTLWMLLSLFAPTLSASLIHSQEALEGAGESVAVLRVQVSTLEVLYYVCCCFLGSFSQIFPHSCMSSEPATPRRCIGWNVRKRRRCKMQPQRHSKLCKFHVEEQPRHIIQLRASVLSEITSQDLYVIACKVYDVGLALTDPPHIPVDQSLPQLSVQFHAREREKDRLQHEAIASVLDLTALEDVFVEFGAGRGLLSNYLISCMRNRSRHCLIDRRRNIKGRADRYHPLFFIRRHCDIRSIVDLDQTAWGSDIPQLLRDQAKDSLRVAQVKTKQMVERVETQGDHAFGSQTTEILQQRKESLRNLVDSIENHDWDWKPRGLRCISKHLCGAATDLTLQVIVNHEERRKAGNTDCDINCIAIALCCHNQCTWDDYVGKEYFQSMDLDKKHFDVMCAMSSWAVSNKDDVNLQSRVSAVEDGQNWFDLWTEPQKTLLGVLSKRIIDHGRILFMQKQESFKDINIVKYIDRKVTPENRLLLSNRIA